MKAIAPEAHFTGSPPAWRIKKLRSYLLEVRSRGSNPDDSCDDLEHRAALRVFARARAKATPAKGKKRKFSEALQQAIWRELIPGRIVGDGPSVIHRRIADACRAIGEKPPVVSTISQWYFNCCPNAMQSAIGIEDPPLPCGDIAAIAELVHEELERIHPSVFSPPEIVTQRDCYTRDQHRWTSIIFAEKARHVWWTLTPSWERCWQSPPAAGRQDLGWWCWVRGDNPHCEHDWDEEKKWLRSHNFGDFPSIYAPAEGAAAGLLRFRKHVGSYVVLSAGAVVSTAARTQVLPDLYLDLPPGALRKLQVLAEVGELGATPIEVARYLVIRGLADFSV